jgi:hypothetical protein
LLGARGSITATIRSIASLHERFPFSKTWSALLNDLLLETSVPIDDPGKIRKMLLSRFAAGGIEAPQFRETGRPVLPLSGRAAQWPELSAYSICTMLSLRFIQSSYPSRVRKTGQIVCNLKAGADFGQICHA